MLPKIFVQIASYRDAECQWTVRELFKNAAHPQRLNIGICWQYHPVEDKDLLVIDEAYAPQVRLMKIESKDSQGACWARHQVQKLWQGEEYVLQIDSHMRFEPAWDEKLITMLAKCPSEKAVLTSYPCAYLPPDKLAKSTIQLLTAYKFDENDGILRFMGSIRGKNNSVPLPIQGMFVSGNFLFGKSQMIKDVPYDPYLYFYGEEISLAVRLWTHGYDIYHPNENVLFHYYKEAGDKTNRTHWNDHDKWHVLNGRAIKRLEYLLGAEEKQNADVLIDIEKYGLGNVRTLQQYQEVAGVNFKDKLLSPAALQCDFFTDPELRKLNQPENKNVQQLTMHNANMGSCSVQTGKLMDLSWLGWVHGNLERGCDKREIRDTLLTAGFSLDTVRAVLGVLYTDEIRIVPPMSAMPQQNIAMAQQNAVVAQHLATHTTSINHYALFDTPAKKLAALPKSTRFDSSKLQIYIIDDFMSPAECKAVMAAMESSLRPSTITYGEQNYRTSMTCDLSLLQQSIVKKIDTKIAKAIGIQLPYSEGIQGQKYSVGQEFKDHTDYFEPGIEYQENCRVLGNRTWTFMVYLNDVTQGGGTRFSAIDHTFYPKQGRAVVWNSLNVDGKPNINTMHAGLPIEAGEKYIITKWFRERGTGPLFY